MNLKVADAKREEGFTLIELLVVVIIIGILAAIAIPVFLNQRERAWIRTAESDVRNAAIEIESFFNDDFAYPAAFSNETDGVDITGDGNLDIQISPGVTLSYDTFDTGAAYYISACHELVEADCTTVPAGVDGSGDPVDVDATDNLTASYVSNAGGVQ